MPKHTNRHYPKPVHLLDHVKKFQAMHIALISKHNDALQLVLPHKSEKNAEMMKMGQFRIHFNNYVNKDDYEGRLCHLNFRFLNCRKISRPS
jgi:hypothetical protein